MTRQHNSILTKAMDVQTHMLLDNIHEELVEYGFGLTCGAKEGIYGPYFLCAELRDEELPWSATETDW